MRTAATMAEAEVGVAGNKTTVVAAEGSTREGFIVGVSL